MVELSDVIKSQGVREILGSTNGSATEVTL